jgi:hypothetical protein
LRYDVVDAAEWDEAFVSSVSRLFALGAQLRYGEESPWTEWATTSTAV